MDKALDLRSREGQEQHIVRQVKKHGGFSIFWITANQKRAHAGTRLVNRGVIVEDKNTPFPWCSFKVADNE